jgi:hypothetical protein
MDIYLEINQAIMSLESLFDGNLETLYLDIPSEAENQVSQVRVIMEKLSQGRYVALIDVVVRSENIRPPTLHSRRVRIIPVNIVDIKDIFSV